MSGNWGKILRVNLSKSTIKEETIPDEWIKKFLGGRGIAVRYLIEEVPKGADPLGPENEGGSSCPALGARTGDPGRGRLSSAACESGNRPDPRRGCKRRLEGTVGEEARPDRGQEGRSRQTDHLRNDPEVSRGFQLEGSFRIADTPGTERYPRAAGMTTPQ